MPHCHPYDPANPRPNSVLIMDNASIHKSVLFTRVLKSGHSVMSLVFVWSSFHIQFFSFACASFAFSTSTAVAVRRFFFTGGPDSERVMVGVFGDCRVLLVPMPVGCSSSPLSTSSSSSLPSSSGLEGQWNAVGCNPGYPHLLSPHCGKASHQLLNLQPIASFRNRSPGSIPSSFSHHLCSAFQEQGRLWL